MAKDLTSNEQILDSYIRHQTYLLRYAGGLRNEVLPSLVATEKKLYDSVVEWIAKAEGDRTLIGASGGQWQKDFEATLNEIRQPVWDDISETIATQMKDLAVVEAAVGARVIESALPVVIGMGLPPASKLVAIVNSQPFEGRTLKEWMKRTADADVQRMLSYAKIGIVQGQTPTQVARGIIGSRAANYTDGQARKAFKDVESVILTVTNGIQNEAKQALYEANADIIDKELFVNTLDVRTTIECIAAGEANPHSLGKGIYPRGVGPMPPLHFRCRSLRVPFINAENLGNRGFDSSTEKQLVGEYTKANDLDTVATRDALPGGHKTKYDEFARKRRRELVGQVPATTSYSDWLKTQTKDFQDEVLGATRAQMFRDGEITLDKFTTSDNNVLTLDQLRRKGLDVPDSAAALSRTTAKPSIDPDVEIKAVQIKAKADAAIATAKLEAAEARIKAAEAKAAKAEAKAKAAEAKAAKATALPLPRDEFRQFKNGKEADTYYEGKINATTDHAKAIYNYTDRSYLAVNYFLRKDGKKHPRATANDYEAAEKSIATLNDFLHNNRTTEPIRVYRGIKQELLEGFKIGDVLEDKAFMSTVNFENKLLLWKFAGERNAMYLEILVDKGAPGVSIKEHSKYGHENEFLLKGGKLTVEGIDGNKVIVRYSEL